MGKVQLKFPPSFAGMLNVESSDWVIFEKEIGKEATIGDILTGLASSYTDLRKLVFNPDTGKAGEEVIILLNDNLLQFPGATETRLNDGDSILILPVYPGG